MIFTRILIPQKTILQYPWKAKGGFHSDDKRVVFNSFGKMWTNWPPASQQRSDCEGEGEEGPGYTLRRGTSAQTPQVPRLPSSQFIQNTLVSVPTFLPSSPFSPPLSVHIVWFGNVGQECIWVSSTTLPYNHTPRNHVSYFSLLFIRGLQSTFK